MPFTISHAATALPFFRTRLVFFALVIGTMSPDFEYLVMHGFERAGAHTLPGLFYFCIPTGLVVLYLYHCLWLPVIMDHCPNPLRLRLIAANRTPFHFGPLARFINIIFSLLLGALLHLGFDLLSHGYGESVKLFPWLLQKVPGLPMLHWWAFFHGLGSILGLGILVVALLVWYRKTSPVLDVDPPKRISVRTGAALVALGVGFSFWFSAIRSIEDYYGMIRYVAYFVLGGMCYSVALLTVLGVHRRIVIEPECR